MKLETLIHRLKKASRISEEDMELGHMEADAALIEYIGHAKVTEAYDEVVKNYERRLRDDDERKAAGT